jgi:WD40 repeat protein
MTGAAKAVPGWQVTRPDWIRGLAWSGSGDLWVVDAAGSTALLDGTSGRVLAEAPLHADAVAGVARAPRVVGAPEAWATWGEDGVLAMWEGRALGDARKVQPGRGWLEHASWRHDAGGLAWAVGRTWGVVDRVGEVRSAPAGLPMTALSVASHPSRPLVALSHGGGAVVADGDTLEVTQSLATDSALYGLCFSPCGGVLIGACQDASLRFWRTDGWLDSAMSGYESRPSAMDWHSRGPRLVCGGGPSPTVWSFAAGGPEGTRPDVLEGLEDPVRAVGFSPTGDQVFAGTVAGQWALWTVRGGWLVSRGRVSSGVTSLAWRPDGRGVVLGLEDGSVVSFRVH